MGKQSNETDIKKVNANLQVENTAKRKKNMLKALRKANGIVTKAIEKANINRATHYKWIKTDPDYKQAVNDIDEEQLDFTESMLRENIKSKKEASIFFHLKTKGKHRGYIERQETVDRSQFEDRLENLTDEELDEIEQRLKKVV